MAQQSKQQTTTENEGAISNKAVQFAKLALPK